MPDAADIFWRGIPLTLLAERAAFRADTGALLLADLHLGKSAAFRALGSPVPDGDAQHDLDRLSSLIARLSPERLIILGDLLHAREGRAPEVLAALARFRARHARLPITLVRGNHDARAGDPSDSLSIECVEPPLRLDGASLVHDPDAHDDAPRIGGHTHPAVRLSSRSGDSIRTPCFWLRPDSLTLPAFGCFTGGRRITPSREDRVFAIGPGAIVEFCAQQSTTTRT